jgi:hypothetical protein
MYQMIYMWGQQFILCRSAKREPWEAMAKSCLLFVFARVVEALDATCDSQAAYDFVFVG